VRAASLRVIAREWLRIGCVGFGGPPAHIALLRELCVDRRAWIAPGQFEDDIAAAQLLPGPASTQLAILSAHRVGGGRVAGLVGGLCFIAPGFVAVIALAALFLAGSPPRAVVGAGAGAGAAVAAVALDQGLGLARGHLAAAHGARRRRAVAYAVAGALAAALLGADLVLVLLGCGLLELGWRRGVPSGVAGLVAPPLAVAGTGGLGALAWVAFKVGALSYGGGFVIIPLMQDDAVDRHHWLTDGQFLNAVALGQVTPGPVVHTVSAVGYAAAGVGGALLAAAVAFAPSFAFVLLGAARFDRLLRAPGARAFIDGAAPAALGAIAGSAIPLAAALRHTWQVVVLGVAVVALVVARRGVVAVLLGAAAAGTALVLGGAPV
jgi:chromate transporter